MVVRFVIAIGFLFFYYPLEKYTCSWLTLRFLLKGVVKYVVNHNYLFSNTMPNPENVENLNTFYFQHSAPFLVLIHSSKTYFITFAHI